MNKNFLSLITVLKAGFEDIAELEATVDSDLNDARFTAVKYLQRYQSILSGMVHSTFTECIGAASTDLTSLKLVQALYEQYKPQGYEHIATTLSTVILELEKTTVSESKSLLTPGWLDEIRKELGLASEVVTESYKWVDDLFKGEK